MIGIKNILKHLPFHIIITEQHTKRGVIQMNRNFRILAASAVYLIGFAVSIYVGGWLMLLKPLRSAIAAYTLGTLSLSQFIVTIIKCISSMTVAGFIWCIGYIASNHIYDSRDE